MKLLVGLGNPGRKHERNRHNIGFLVVDRIASANGMDNWRSRHQGLVAEGRLDGERVILLKPQTWMNNSGQSVGEAMRYLKLTPADLFVFHDELDLAPGKIRSKTGGGHAGHNGLRSIHQHIGPDFCRVRLGIGHPGQKHVVSQYVLSDFYKSDSEWLAELLDAIEACAPVLVVDGASAFQNCLGRKRQATASGPSQEKLPAVEDGPEPARGVFHSLLRRLQGRGQDRE